MNASDTFLSPAHANGAPPLDALSAPSLDGNALPHNGEPRNGEPHGEVRNGEAELLLLGARLHPSAAAQARLLELLDGARGPLEWEQLMVSAGRQGVLPLLFWNLQRIAGVHPGRVPREVLASMHSGFLRGAVRSMNLTRELLALLDWFAARGVPVIPYKGPVVAQAAYGNLALRWFGDLDVLIHRRDVARVHRLLLARGYEQQFHATHEGAEYAHKYTSPGAATLEVHWDVLPAHYASPLQVEAMWERLCPLSFAGQQVLAPSPEDLLLLLCLHGYKHRWNRLEWIACLAELTRPGQPMNWGLVLRRAREVGSRRIVFLGLQLARELLDARYPALVTREIDGERAIPALVRASRQALLQAMFDTEVDGEVEGPSFFHLRARERMRDKLRYVGGFLTSPGQLDWKGALHHKRHHAP